MIVVQYFLDLAHSCIASTRVETDRALRRVQSRLNAVLPEKNDFIQHPVLQMKLHVLRGELTVLVENMLSESTVEAKLDTLTSYEMDTSLDAFVEFFLDWAQNLAEQLLAEPLPRRWAHSQGVGRRAESLADVLGDDAELLAAAAWLHDIGYAPSLVRTGMHSIDGARYLRDVEGADPRICSLVAHHSCACIEARHRGLEKVLADEFPPVGGLLTDALTYADMTTSPDGHEMEVDARLADILERYGAGSVVFNSVSESGPLLVGSVQRISELVTSAQR